MPNPVVKAENDLTNAAHTLKLRSTRKSNGHSTIDDAVMEEVQQRFGM